MLCDASWMLGDRTASNATRGTHSNVGQMCTNAKRHLADSPHPRLRVVTKTLANLPAAPVSTGGDADRLCQKWHPPELVLHYMYLSPLSRCCKLSFGPTAAARLTPASPDGLDHSS